MPPDEVQWHGSIRITTPARSIVDAARAGTDPRQVIAAVWQAMERHLATTDALRALAARGEMTPHYRYVQRIIDETLVDYAA